MVLVWCSGGEGDGDEVDGALTRVALWAVWRFAAIACGLIEPIGTVPTGVGGGWRPGLVVSCRGSGCKSIALCDAGREGVVACGVAAGYLGWRLCVVCGFVCGGFGVGAGV